MTVVQLMISIWFIHLYAGISVFAAWMHGKSRDTDSPWKILCYGGIFGAGCATFLFLLALLVWAVNNEL